ncbi:hypothetical protein VNI00_012418 [Paramarasmius palmivorus]|uniref:FAD-binding PCMH-type domain-containing protein n=1 Tax=Paramarasmius palmivorus TaxID=297713 RepID=A0AAW0C483_9AGAR
MLRYILLAVIQASLLLNTWALPADIDIRATSEDKDACGQIQKAISSASELFYPGSEGYDRDIAHWAPSSSQQAACSVEPGNTDDLSKIIQIIGSTRAKFAVKAGGHTANAKWSSTAGVQIVMYRFNEVSYDAKTQTATVGTGLVWDDVYAGLEPYNVHVAGARVTGIGVGGFIMGGGNKGYSWFMNQYGLAIDTVVAYELVKPDGSVGWVTESSDPDLFFALKGGMNNFGVVTRIILKAFPGGLVWGGLIQYVSGFDQVMAAVQKFTETVTDPKAAILTTFNYVLGNLGISQQLFYDGPNPPPDIFDDFLSGTAQSVISDVKTRTLYDLIRSTQANATAGTRAVFNTVPLKKITLNMMQAVVNETKFYAEAGTPNSGVFTAYTFEPHLSDILTHTNSPSAWPPSRSSADYPLFIHYAWTSESADESFRSAIKQSVAHLTDVAKAEGQKDVGKTNPYPNYVYDANAKKVYGDNLPKLKEIKKRVDPQDVMGLAGGLKIRPWEDNGQ